MLRRVGHWGLIAFVAAWFGVIVPGHQRGSVVLPGYAQEAEAQGEQADLAADVCEIGKARSCCERPADGSPAPVDPVEKCAICYLVATLSVPPVVDLSLPLTDRVGLLPDIDPTFEPTPVFLPTYDSRGPPAVSCS